MLSVYWYRDAPQARWGDSLPRLQCIGAACRTGFIGWVGIPLGLSVLAYVVDNSLKEGWLAALPMTEWLQDHLVVWLRSLRSTIFSVWLAYTVVWMAYGLRLISSTLLQVGPELEEAARSTGARRGQVTRHVTIPLSRYGLIGSWLLMFLIFEREYSTGVYLLSPGTETIGSMLVSLWAAGAIDIVAALSFINILLVVLGLGIALRFGVKLHD